MQDQQNPNPEVAQPENTTINTNSIYPEPTRGVLAEVPSIAAVKNTPEAPAAVRRPVDFWTIALLILLLMTFFSPLGSMLFLPILIVGLGSASRYLARSNSITYQNADNAYSPPPPSPAASLLRTLVNAVLVIVIIIMALPLLLIAMIFLSPGSFNMGS